MKIKTLTIAFLFLNLFSFSQQAKIDSLKNELKKESSQKEKLDVYKSLCTELNKFASPEESIPYFEQAIYLAKKLKDTKFEARVNRFTFVSYQHSGDNDKALKYLNKALYIDKKINNINGILLDVNLLGTFYTDNQKYQKAINTYKEGISIFNENDSSEIICTIYTNLGIVYGLSRNLEKAVRSFYKSIEYAEKYKSYEDKNFALHHLGVVYMNVGNYKKAEKYFLESLEDSVHNRFPVWRNANHSALAFNYWCMGEYEKSIKQGKISEEFYHQTGNIFYEFESIRYQVQSYNYLGKYKEAIEAGNRALKLADKINFKNIIYALKVNISTAYVFDGQNDKAEKYLFEVLDYINQSKNNERINTQRLFKNFSKLYENKKNFEKALLYYKKYQKLSDEALKKQRDSKVTEIETKYQTEKKEKENLRLKKEKAEQTLMFQKEKHKKIYFGTALIASVLFILIFAYFFRRNKKQKKLIENLQKELHHRIKNNLSVIDTFIEVAKEEFNNPAFNNKLTELHNRIAGINEVHKQLYVSKDITNINLKKYIEKLSENVTSSFNNNNVELIQDIDDDVKLYADKSFPVGLIINEFITNSFKYAFGEEIKGKIKIKIQETKNAFSLILSDNGKGLPENFDIEKTQTFGMRIMKLLTQQLKGTFKFENADGLKISIQFPK